jgi:hypothetical protein
LSSNKSLVKYTVNEKNSNKNINNDIGKMVSLESPITSIRPAVNIDNITAIPTKTLGFI